MTNCDHYKIILILFILLFIVLISYLSTNLCSNFENKKYLTKPDYLDSHKSKFYSLRSGQNEKSLISKINHYIKK